MNEIFCRGKRQVLNTCVDDLSYQVIGSQRDDKFLQGHFRCFRAQYIHIHDCLDLSDTDFNVPRG